MIVFLRNMHSEIRIEDLAGEKRRPRSPQERRSPRDRTPNLRIRGPVLEQGRRPARVMPASRVVSRADPRDQLGAR